MCIICYKPEGVTFPNKKTIKTMFNNNPDGAGMMYLSDDNVIIKKGFMTFNSFWTEYQKHRDDINTPYVFHFRITTNGGTRKGLTHPFPLSSDDKILTATDLKTNIGICHNGIIPMTAHAKNTSDTALFIKQYATKLLRNGINDGDILDVIEECIQSKMVLLDTNGSVQLLGQFEKSKGCYYSNSSYTNSTTNNRRSIKHDDIFDNCELECDYCPKWDECYNSDMLFSQIEKRLVI